MTGRKRVLHVLFSVERSGMEMMLACSYAEWQDHGYECDVLTTAPTEGPIADTLRIAGYNVFNIPFKSSIPYLPNLRFPINFFRLCSSYDVVHVHTEAGTTIFVVLAKLAGVGRVALTPHNTFRFHGLLRARKFVERAFNRAMGGRYGMISDAVQACELEFYANAGPRIWNWLNTAHYRKPKLEERRKARQALALKDTDFMLVSVGNCNSIKNHPQLIRALALMGDAAPLYVHVGREQPDHAERDLATSLGITEKILFVGSVADPREYLWAGDAFVMPSLHEGLGLSALEAISCGLPAILADVDGLREVAAEAGTVLKTGTDAESIAQAIHQITGMSREEREHGFSTASEQVSDHFSIAHGVSVIASRLYENHRDLEA